MTYKKMFETDSEYKEIVNTYKSDRKELDRKINDVMYSKLYLRDEATNIHGFLVNSIRDFRNKRIEEAKERMAFAQKPRDVGYAARPNDVKEFEMRFKLAENHQIGSIVQELDSEDLLELNILRLELKSRGMEKEDQAVKMYITRNKLDGMDAAEQSDYDFYKERLKNHSSVGSGYIVMDGALKTLDGIRDEMYTQIRERDVKQL